MRAVAVVLLVLAVAVLPLLSLHPSAAEVWARLNFTVTGYAFYDYDSDGDPELLLQPEAVLDGGALLSSPYPGSLKGVLVLDVDGDGERELLLYNATTGVYRAYSGVSPDGEWSLPPGEPRLCASGSCVIAGGSVLYRGVVYDVGVPYNFTVATYAGSVYAVYCDGERLVAVRVNDNSTWTIWYGELTPLAAAYAGGSLYVLARTPYGDTVLAVYDFNSTSLHTYTITPLTAFKWLHSARSFAVQAPDGIYLVGPGRLVLVTTGELIGWSTYSVIVWDGSKIRVVTYGGTQAAEFEPPAEPARAVYGYGVGLVTTVDGESWLLRLVPTPRAYYMGPRTVYAGEPFEYRITVVNAEAARAFFDGAPVPLNGTLVAPSADVHRLSVVLVNGPLTETVNFTVKAEPRPLSVAVSVLDHGVLFGNASLRVTAVDTLDAAPANTTCNASVGNWTWQFTPNQVITIPVMPGGGDSMVVNIVVECGDGFYYERVRRLVGLKPGPATPIVEVSYTGNGTLVVELRGRDGSELEGEALVYVEGALDGTIRVPGQFSLDKPGTYNITLVVQPYSPLYSMVVHHLRVVYHAGPAGGAPTNETVIVVPAETVTVTATETHTLEHTNYTTVTVPVARVSPEIVGATAIIGAIVGASAGYLAANRRTQAGAPTGREKSEEESRGEYSLEFESA